MRELKLIKNRSDIGAGTRGSDLGVDAIEIAAINQKNDYFNRFESDDVDTENESIYNKVNNSFAKRIEHVFYQCTRVANNVEYALKSDKFPLVMSGDHSSALGTISGIKAANPDKRIGVIWIDAHADLHSPYTSPSGNIHGMPLAAAIADDNVDCQINEVTDNTDKYWEALKKVGTDGAKILPEDVIFFGVRDTEEPEEKQMAKYRMKNYMVDEVRYRGLEVCVEEAMGRLEDCDLLYISFDVDSMDCDLISHGTGTPVSKGFDETEIKQIITSFLETEKVGCLEFVEINPTLDEKKNKMAETAFEILEDVLPVIEKINA